MNSEEKDRLFRKGIACFNSAHFYDAHEHWEEVWLETPNPEKLFLQGLIQITAAYHHYSRANRLGTGNLLRAGLAKLDNFPEHYRGIEIELLRIELREWLSLLDAGENPDDTAIPLIHYNSSPSTSR